MLCTMSTGFRYRTSTPSELVNRAKDNNMSADGSDDKSRTWRRSIRRKLALGQEVFTHGIYKHKI